MTESTKGERRLRTKDRRANSDNSCMCASDPWRHSHTKVFGDIAKLEAEQATLWDRLNGMVSVKMFGLFMTILTTILIAFCASMYDTNKQTLSIVTQINEKVLTLEVHQDFYGYHNHAPLPPLCAMPDISDAPFLPPFFF